MKLEIGYNHPFEIRRETYVAGCNASFSVLYLSDLHFTRSSGQMTETIAAAIEKLDPSIILFGGDYSDSQHGLVHLNTLMQAVAHRKNVFAIAGNHDSRWIERIKTIAYNNNVQWIEKRSVHVNIAGARIRIDGNCITTANSDCDFSILALHKPVNAEQMKNNYNLALAGHLHGSQFVFWRSGEGLFPGKLFYRWNILKTKADDCLYMISKGLGDTLPIRYNCKRDVLLIQVTPNTQPLSL